MANLETKVNSIITGMKRRGINFVAIDFDLTLSSIHAGGSDWKGSVDDLIVSQYTGIMTILI
jgi:hypothetical protein